MQLPTENPPAIQAIELSKQFDGRRVLRQLDLDLMPGQSIAVMGDNGAGKTTLLRCLAGVTRPDAGQICWLGQPLNRRVKISKYAGMAAHESQLYPNLTLLENLMFAARMHAVARPRQQAEIWLDRIKLLSSARCMPSQVSHGMRRRVSLARALIHQPQIILLDEPFSGIDRRGQDWLAELLTDLQRRNHSICFSTHNAERARLSADRVLKLQNGKLQNVSDFPHPTHTVPHQPQRAA